MKAPDEARLPFYHNYKLLIGWVLFVLILFVALLLVGLQGKYVEEAAAIAMAPLGAHRPTYLPACVSPGEAM